MVTTDAPPSSPSAFADDQVEVEKVAAAIATFRVPKPKRKPSVGSNPLSVGSEAKPSVGSRRKTNPDKPPSVAGFKWSQNGSGWDCKAYEKHANGSETQQHLAYLGKRELATMRKAATDREDLRRLVKEWIAQKRTEKGR